MFTIKQLSFGMAVIVLSLFFTAELFAQADEIQKRRLLMENNNDTVVKALVKAVKEKDFAEVQIKVKGIMENMDELVTLFPKGSISEKSRAKPEIWEKWDEFSKLPGTVKKAAQALGDAAKTKNEADVEVKLKALGDACNACHRDFRAPRKSS